MLVLWLQSQSALPGHHRRQHRNSHPFSHSLSTNGTAPITNLTGASLACSHSLPSRDIIADSIETVMCGQWYDANISLPGCDKNMPGVVMAMARFNRPSIMVYGGTIKPGCSKIDGRDLNVTMTFESYGE